jgi:pyruvate dehydrogenase E1 component beta subunit
MAVMTVREALRSALREQLKDDRVFIIGEDIGYYGSTYGVTAGFLEEYGTEKIRDAPIAEAGIIGIGIGAAMLGMRPICEIMSVNFSLLAFDQIVNHAAKLHYMFGGQMTCPMVLRTTNGWRNLSATHSQSFDSLFAYVPGLKVVAPATPADMKALFKASMEDPDPVIFIEHTLMYGAKGEVPDGDYEVKIGESRLPREDLGPEVRVADLRQHLLGRRPGFRELEEREGRYDVEQAVRREEPAQQPGRPPRHLGPQVGSLLRGGP